MSKISIRRAVSSDVATIETIVRDAYARYIDRIGREPAPMLDDYDSLVRNDDVWVLAENEEICGLVVLHAKAGHVLIDNLAVATTHQGRGLGKRLLDHAESYAREHGADELRLYTNELMHENVTLYSRLGWDEYRRAEEDGFRRVFMRKKVHLR